MEKRGDEHGQVRQEEFDALIENSSDARKGPFQKASEEVTKERRIVRSARKFSAAKQSSTPSTEGNDTRTTPVNQVRRRNRYKTSGVHQVRRNNRGQRAPIDNAQMNKLLLNARPAIEAIFHAKDSDNQNYRTAFANKKIKPNVRLHAAFAGVPLTVPPSTNPFGGFFFGPSTPAAAPSTTTPKFSSNASTPASVQAARKTSFPAFATPAAVAKVTTSKLSRSTTASGNTTKDDEKIKCAQGFLEHLKGGARADMACYQQFRKTYAELSESVGVTSKAAEKSTATTSTSSNSWDSSRSPFGGSKPLVSPTAGSTSAAATTTNLFGASGPSPAAKAGGSSFNPTKTRASSAPVPSFSCSTTPSAAVKEAAKNAAAATATSSKPGSTDDGQKQEEEEGELETANDVYQVLYKTKTETKIFHVSKNAYIKGLLKLEKNRESGKNRLVVRDAITGKVKMNSAISKGMPLFKGMAPATKKKGPTPIVIIKTLFDENSKVPEVFKLITTTNEEHENLFNELKRLITSDREQSAKVAKRDFEIL